ncbi:MAG: phosphoribosylformylglycinamidine cyclo-ligase [Armatimonadetes bacterium]|nr:phosphoribosylformylglycinamidine cyclo-ligase [Armatimonadota bacterium]
MERDSYAAAGVDINAQDRAIDLIRAACRSTYRPEVVTDVGSFGGMFALDPQRYRQPVLVSSIDGIGTKIKVAVAAGIHDTVGMDLVHHCVNDIAVMGAEPLFFLDYFATGRLAPEVAAAVVKGLAEGCRNVGCALIGGELAEMPGMYQLGDYDVAGCIVGLVERGEVVDGRSVVEGDVVLGLPSSGLHTNGYSLARKLMFEAAAYKPKTFIPELDCTAAEELLKIHRSYLKPIQKLAGNGLLLGAAHITGGGISDNTPRILPQGVAAEIKVGSWPILPIFELLRRLGNIPEDDYRRTFNLGIGMILVVPEKKAVKARRLLDRMKEPHFVIGRAVRQPRGRKERVVYR